MRTRKSKNGNPQILREILKFRDDRNWAQFHTAKDLALGLSIEAAELNEAFLWKESKDASIEKVKEELADVLVFSLLLLDKYNLSFEDVIRKKLAINSKKYPIKKSYGSSKKYDEFQS